MLPQSVFKNAGDHDHAADNSPITLRGDKLIIEQRKYEYIINITQNDLAEN